MKIERTEWARFERWLARGKLQGKPRAYTGQHSVIVGMNGSGKTVLASRIVPLFGSSGVLVDGKGGDDPAMAWPGWITERSWPPAEERHVKRWDPKHRRDPIRIRIAPKMGTRAEQVAARGVLGETLIDLFSRRGTKRYDVIYVDEMGMVARWMRMSDDVAVMLQQLRYRPVSVVVGLQWPTWLPKESYRETTHRFVFRPAAEEDRKFVAQNVMTGDRAQLMEALSGLRRYEFAYQDVNEPDRLVISKVDLK